MADAMVPNGNAETILTIITINMQPLLQNGDKKSDETRVKYCEMGEREQMKKSLSIE